jgi:2-keto-3-deoxy-L-fuconate dehydrogenase
MKRLENKIAVVTGAGGGIGSAICKRFTAEGARVAGLDLVEPDTAELNLSCDLANADEVAARCYAISDLLGSPDIVVHCAASTEFADTLSADRDVFQHIMTVNVFGAMQLARHFAPAMGERGSGSFVFISSITGIVGAPGLASYAASKGALNTATRTLALELAGKGVRVNSICPASVDTPLLRASFQRQPDPLKALQENIKRHPLGRLGTPEDIANLALFLGSDEASWITGTNSVIDGGATINRR